MSKLRSILNKEPPNEDKTRPTAVVVASITIDESEDGELID